jgi:hypothetical protein
MPAVGTVEEVSQGDEARREGGAEGPRWYPPGVPRPVPRQEMARKLIYQAPAGGVVSP